MRYTQLVEKVLMDFSAKLRKISILVSQVLKFCDSDGKENPDGFLSHYLSLRILWSKRFFNSLRTKGYPFVRSALRQNASISREAARP